MSGFKYIAVPEPVQFRGKITVTFAAFVTHLLNGDDRYNKDGVGIRAAARLEQQLASDGAVLRLTPEDWKRLREVAEKPTCGYPTLVSTGGEVHLQLGRCILPFVNAIAAASDTPLVKRMPDPEPKPTSDPEPALMPSGAR